MGTELHSAREEESQNEADDTNDGKDAHKVGRLRDRDVPHLGERLKRGDDGRSRKCTHHGVHRNLNEEDMLAPRRPVVRVCATVKAAGSPNGAEESDEVQGRGKRAKGDDREEDGRGSGQVD